MEHFLYHHIIEYLYINSILIDQQFGFRSGHSCEAQLISVVEGIHLAMDHSHQVDVIFIDFQKAFDKVPHHRLITNLYHYGIRGKVHEWISTWLTQ